MTPRQIALVEQTMASVDLDDLAADFYQRAFTTDPVISAMFTSDPVLQRARFAAELNEILHSLRSVDTFLSRTQELGLRHRAYGVRAPHYRVMGEALLAALAAALGDGWTPEVDEAWMLAYNLTAEAMMLGALGGRPTS